MARLYAATGDGIVRLDEASGEWIVEHFLGGSGAQCLAVDPHDADTLYAGLREQGVRRTQDGGRSWVDCALPEPGVFSLAVSAADGSVYAGTEPSRLFRSNERGESWQPADEGRDRHYTWSVAVDPDDPELWYVSASTGPYAAHGRRDPKARIYRRRAGEPWHALADGLPEPLPAMPYALVATEGRLFAGLADGQLWESSDRGDNWRACRFQGDSITALRALVYTSA